MGNIIEARELTKSFRDVRAVDRLSMGIGRGEIYGFLGLNGAGKTTAIRMLLGLLRPDGGTASILGCRVTPGRHRLWASVGHMVDEPRSYPELTVQQNLELVRRLRRVTEPEAVTRVVEQLGLAPYRHVRAQHLSLGNARRLGLAKALIHEPAVLILDEPTNGLDPAGTAQIRKLLQSLAADRGVAILLSSHLLGEISRLATRIGIIHRGRLIKEYRRQQLLQQMRPYLLVETRQPARAWSVLRAAGYTLAEGGPHSSRLLLADGKAVARPDDVADLLVAAGAPPLRLQVKKENLEEYFLRIIGGAGDGGK